MDFMPNLGEEGKEKAQEWEQSSKFFRHSFAPDCPIAFFQLFHRNSLSKPPCFCEKSWSSVYSAVFVHTAG